MQVFLYLFGGSVYPPSILLKYPLVETRMCEAKEYRSRKSLPHFSSQTVGETDLDESRTLWVPQEGNVATVDYGESWLMYRISANKGRTLQIICP